MIGRRYGRSKFIVVGVKNSDIMFYLTFFSKKTLLHFSYKENTMDNRRPKQKGKHGRCQYTFDSSQCQRGPRRV